MKRSVYRAAGVNNKEVRFKNEMASSIVQQHGRLQVKGNQIVNQKGKPVTLRGMSLFWSQWIGKYYNRDAVRWLQKDWGCTLIRAAMAVGSGGYLEHPEQEKQKVIAVVDAAIEAGVYVLIDWHDHNADQHVKEAKTFFGEMAKRYAKHPNVIYETFNEPLNKQDWSKTLKPYHEAVIAEIRRYDKQNLVICGTGDWSQKVDDAASDSIKAANVAYTLHFYAGTHKKWLRDRAQAALKSGIALMVTKCGTTEASGNGPIDYDETPKWLAFLDANHISWCNWSIADKDESSAALIPGANPEGGWPKTAISPSGQFIRDEIRKKNALTSR